jgi:CRP-like cAMP-binding protein
MPDDLDDVLELLGAQGHASRDQTGWRLKTAERQALAGNSWFAGIAPAIRHDLLRSIHVRSYESGEWIFHTGSAVRAWMVCLAGAVRIAAPFSAGERSITLRFLRPGQWFGDLPEHGSPVHTHDASAFGSTRVGVVDREAVCALMDKHPQFHACLLEWQSMRLASVFGLLEERATLGLSARMVRQLHRLAKDYGKPEGGEVRIGLPLVQSDIAALVGCSRQRANQVLRELARQRLIRQDHGAFVVTDRKALERMVNDTRLGDATCAGLET